MKHSILILQLSFGLSQVTQVRNTLVSDTCRKVRKRDENEDEKVFSVLSSGLMHRVLGI